jgi:Predicted solute binding protein
LKLLNFIEPTVTSTTTTTTTAAPTTTTTSTTSTTSTTTTAAPTTTTTTTAAPTTTTTTTIPTGTCRFVFVPDYVDTTGYGLRTNLGGEVNQLFTALEQLPITVDGEEGVVYNVCSTIVPQYWEQSTNTTIAYPSGVLNLEDGGSCTEDADCVYSPDTTTTTTAAPTTTTTTLSGCVAVDISTATFATAALACSAGDADAGRRTDGDPADPQIGDTIFTNISCSTTLAAGIYYHIAGAAITVDSSGVITNVEFC